MADERKDRLIQRHQIPNDIQCKLCNSKMQFECYLFKEDDTQLLFVFKCLSGHLPKKVIRTEGREYHFPERKCGQCGGKLISSTEKKNENHFKFIDTCSSCGHTEINEFEVDSDPQKNITEQELMRYCTFFNNQRTFYEDLKAIADFSESIDRDEKIKKEKEELEVNKIEKPNVPQLEKKLADIAEKNGFIKLQFDKPEIGRHVLISFSLQDSSERSEQESLKIITSSFKKALFNTSWRLMTDGIYYRLGYLTGRLKSHDQEEDLLKIAKEIKNNKNKPTKESGIRKKKR